MVESFFMSNMAPQVGIGLNRAIWAKLEGAVRQWADDFGLIVAISGPVYGDKPATIGETGVVVPAGFYKIVYQPDRRRAVAFLFPNRRIPHQDFGKFIVAIAEIEQQTGIDFLAGLPTREQRRLEARKGSPIRAP
jgi:endonuclease G